MDTMLTILICDDDTAFAGKLKGKPDSFRNTYWEIGVKKMTLGFFILLIALAAGYTVCNVTGNLFSLRCMNYMDASKLLTELISYQYYQNLYQAKKLKYMYMVAFVGYLVIIYPRTQILLIVIRCFFHVQGILVL